MLFTRFLVFKTIEESKKMLSKFTMPGKRRKINRTFTVDDTTSSYDKKVASHNNDIPKIPDLHGKPVFNSEISGVVGQPPKLNISDEKLLKHFGKYKFRSESEVHKLRLRFLKDFEKTKHSSETA